MSKDAIKDLTLMLMYLTSWEESLVPGTRKKFDCADFRFHIRRCWKGYDFGILNELTDEGLVNAGGCSKSASFKKCIRKRCTAKTPHESAVFLHNQRLLPSNKRKKFGLPKNNSVF